MRAGRIIWRSAVIGAGFGGALGLVYGIAMPALLLLWAWAWRFGGNRPENWMGLTWAPYTMLAGALFFGPFTLLAHYRSLQCRSCRIGVGLLGALAGAGIGSGPWLLFWIEVPFAAGIAGTAVGFLAGGLFGAALVGIAQNTHESWDEQLQHPDRLRILATAIPTSTVLFVYLVARVHLTVGPGGLVAEFMTALLLLSAVALPACLCGPETQRFY